MKTVSAYETVSAQWTAALLPPPVRGSARRDHWPAGTPHFGASGHEGARGSPAGRDRQGRHRVGLLLSPAKTLITHIDAGLDFLGRRIQRHHERGTNIEVRTSTAIRPRRRRPPSWPRCRHSVDRARTCAARCPAASAQPDAAGLDHVLQVRLLTRDLRLPEVLPVETGHQVARAQAPAHGLEGVAPTLRQRPADRGVELFDPTRVRAELLLLPGSADLDPTAEHRMR